MTVSRPAFRPFASMTLAEMLDELAGWEWLLDAASGERWDDHAIVRGYHDQCAAEIARREQQPNGRG